VVLLGLAYLLVSSSLERKDREIIEGELAELTALYRASGVAGVRDFLGLQDVAATTEPFVVRVLAADGTAVFVWRPPKLATVGVAQLRAVPPAPEGRWTLIEFPGAGIALEMTSTTLSDGGRLEVGGTTGDRERLLESFRRVAVLVLMPVLVLGAVGGALLARSALRPIRHIVHAVRAVSEGEMKTRVPARQTDDELDELIRLFNGMLDRIAALMEGMRSALDSVAHELRTPMMRIRGTAELALTAADRPEAVRQAIGECLEEVDQLLGMLNTLMDISEAEAGALKLRLEPVQLAAVVDEMVELYQVVAQEKKITLSTATAADSEVLADRNRLRQVVANLLDNAIKYTAPGGRVEVSTSRDARGAVLQVRDTGIGIRAAEVARIWERLYRGDDGRAEPGLGLGLSLVRAVVQAHRGSIEVSSVHGAGSTFTVVLPLPLPRTEAGTEAAQLSKL
jgi:signal transduction histidine kinase